jgi:hypothetical protein
MELTLRILSLCLALATVEMLHGIARQKYLAPKLGKERALKLSIVTGSLLAFAVCSLLVPQTGLFRRPELLGLGAGLAAFMAAFDIVVARFLMRRPWSKIVPDFDPRTGNYLLFGLLFLVFAPLLAVWARS